MCDLSKFPVSFSSEDELKEAYNSLRINSIECVQSLEVFCNCYPIITSLLSICMSGYEAEAYLVHVGVG